MAATTPGLRALAAATLSVAIATLAGCSPASESTASATCPEGLSVAFVGLFDQAPGESTSPAQLGANLAVAEFNAANPACQITLKVFGGDGGDAAAAVAAEQIVSNPEIVAVIGPQRSGEVLAAAPVLDFAGVPMVSATATRSDLSAQGWDTFHRVVGTNDNLDVGAALFIQQSLNATRVAVIDDGTPFATDLARIVTDALGADVDVVTTAAGDPASLDAVANQLASYGSDDVVYFAGYEMEAAALLKRLRTAGITASFIGPDTLPSDTFLAGAGADAEGVIATCLCTPLADLPTGEDFAKRFTTAFPDADPDIEYAVESFDATNVVLGAIAEGNVTRSKLNAALKATSWDGVTGSIEFDERGDVRNPRVWVTEVRNAAFVPLTSINTTAAVAAASAERVEVTVIAEPVGENRFRTTGGNGEISYGHGRLVGPATFRGESVEAELLGSVVYTNGSGPFTGFWTLTFANGDALAMTYDGQSTRTDLETVIAGQITVLGGSGPRSEVTGSGSVVGERTSELGTAVEYTLSLALKGLP
jgi:branched-chain amino acid transport system substrate-binding protein